MQPLEFLQLVLISRSYVIVYKRNRLVNTSTQLIHVYSAGFVVTSTGILASGYICYDPFHRLKQMLL